MAKAEPKANGLESLGGDAEGNFAQFTNFMRKLVRVPHSEIKAQLDAEKAAKRRSKASASRASGAPSKAR